MARVPEPVKNIARDSSVAFKMLFNSNSVSITIFENSSPLKYGGSCCLSLQFLDPLKPGQL